MIARIPNRLISSFLAMAALVYSAIAYADTKVLIRFDETGHYVHKVHRTNSPIAQKALVPSNSQATGLQALFRWLDKDGQVLATTRLSDPRTTHAPRRSDSADIAWTILLEGAYMVSGPDLAVQLEIVLPSRNTPQIAAETWLVAL